MTANGVVEEYPYDPVGGIDGLVQRFRVELIAVHHDIGPLRENGSKVKNILKTAVLDPQRRIIGLDGSAPFVDLVPIGSSRLPGFGTRNARTNCRFGSCRRIPFRTSNLLSSTISNTD